LALLEQLPTDAERDTERIREDEKPRDVSVHDVERVLTLDPEVLHLPTNTVFNSSQVQIHMRTNVTRHDSQGTR